jgi:hypothetical protein
MPLRTKQGRKKNRKHGRNRAKCARYAAEHRRTKNNPARTRRDPERTPGNGRRKESMWK